MLEHAELWMAQSGYAAIFVLLMAGVFGIPVPDETLITFIGFLVSQGKLHVVPAWLATVLGSCTGITISYVVGRFFGTAAVQRWGSSLHLTPERTQRVEAWFQHSGKWVLAGGYFVPGFRHVTAMVAGTSGLPVGTFMRFAYAGAALWVSAFMTLGYVVGEDWQPILSAIQRHLYLSSVLFGGVLILVGVIFWLEHRKGS